MKPENIDLFIDRLCGVFPKDNIARNTVKKAWAADDFLLRSSVEDCRKALLILENDGSFPTLPRVKQVLRSLSPVKEFMRTAQEDTEVRGVPIKKGEAVYLSYVSGNRDEDVFVDPEKFDIGRDPNKHLSFGYGVHFCLGASLARMEMNSFFSELIPRIKSIELAGKPDLMATTFVGGLKHLPIRVELKD